MKTAEKHKGKRWLEEVTKIIFNHYEKLKERLRR
jgi:hypothetical protein